MSKIEFIKFLQLQGYKFISLNNIHISVFCKDFIFFGVIVKILEFGFSISCFEQNNYLDYYSESCILPFDTELFMEVENMASTIIIHTLNTL